MNLDRNNAQGERSSGRLSPNGMLGLSDIIGGNGGSTSPQPIPRSTTPNSANGLADVFANGGSTSPNGKSDLSKPSPHPLYRVTIGLIFVNVFFLARQYTSIEQVIGHIYSLCKDQHGCRFLQKKLEDRDSMIVEIIFNEVYDHMTELMIGTHYLSSLPASSPLPRFFIFPPPDMVLSHPLFCNYAGS